MNVVFVCARTQQHCHNFDTGTMSNEYVRLNVFTDEQFFMKQHVQDAHLSILTTQQLPTVVLPKIHRLLVYVSID